MSDNSRIEWTDATWNFVVGCTKVSPGCDHCYAERDVNRWNGPGAFDQVVVKHDRLWLPLKWRRPRRIFVNSLSDLFHADIPDDVIMRAFAVMALTPQHTYQVLTKRHARMRVLLTDEDFRSGVSGEIVNLVVHDGLDDSHLSGEARAWRDWWPLDNVWLGVSVENQQWADIRIPALLDTPAAVRFLSCEPLLGAVSLERWTRSHSDGIDWVIVGGESGPGARPMHVDWARQLRDQCEAADVSYLFKQWGQHDEHGVRRRSKHDAGRELDGRTHDEFPQPAGLPA